MSNGYTLLRLWLFTITIIVSIKVSAQVNLVQQGDFEDPARDSFYTSPPYDKFPLNDQNGHGIVYLEHWGYGPCSKSYWNKKLSHSGNSFMPLFIYMAEGNNDFMIENDCGDLCKPLIKDKDYDVLFYIRPINGNAFIKNIGVAFLSSTVDLNIVDLQGSDPKKNANTVGIKFNLDERDFKGISDRSIGLKPDFMYDQWLDDSTRYTQIHFTYHARGGEKYIYIGNFVQGKPQNWKKTKQFGYGQNLSGRDMCIYGIDDIAVTPLDSAEDGCPPITINNTYNQSSAILLATDAFEQDTLLLGTYSFDKAVTPALQQRVDSLVERLFKAPFRYHVLIIGHTDSVGIETLNEKKSNERATNFGLLLNGKIKQRIFATGMGTTQPYTDNKHDLANRRVDVYLIKAYD